MARIVQAVAAESKTPKGVIADHAFRVTMRIITLFAILLATSFSSQAECYDWPMRIVRGQLAYDADTIYIVMPGLPPEVEQMSVRVNGVDAPEIKGKCDDEKYQAKKGRAFVQDLLAGAGQVRFCNPKWGKYAGRVLADVKIDGADLAEILIKRGFGRAYHGERREGWCLGKQGARHN